MTDTKAGVSCAMQEDEFHLLYPPGHAPATHNAMQNYDFVHTLQIDQMIGIKRESYRGIPDLRIERFFSCDPAVLRYRADVIWEFAESEPLQELLQEALPMIRDVYEMRRVLHHGDGSLESGLSSTRYIEQYLELMALFETRLQPVTPRSEGVRRLKAAVDARCHTQAYQALCTHLKELETRIGQIKSITLGVNLDSNLHVTEAGLVSLNTSRFRAGNLMDRLCGRVGKDPMVCLSGFANVLKAGRNDEKQALDGAVHRALDTIFTKTIRSWEPVINQFYHDETRFFVDMLDDLRFLSSAVAFIQQLQQAGGKLCRPVICPPEKRTLQLHNVYNPMLALKSEGETIVSNDFRFDADGRFYLVTGPNHGGKSIFCYSIGMAQALFQLGLPVPAEQATMSPVTGIYTHFPTSDEDNYGKGRLESECARISEILPCLRDTDLFLMDESFSSTSLIEASYIASEVLAAISEIGCGGVYVTHIHELTQHVQELSTGPGKIDNLVAQMQNIANGTRSYRVLRTTPDGLSYAKDIARKYGLSREEILRRREEAKPTEGGPVHESVRQ